jgi:hypothetical protein
MPSIWCHPQSSDGPLAAIGTCGSLDDYLNPALKECLILSRPRSWSNLIGQSWFLWCRIKMEPILSRLLKRRLVSDQGDLPNDFSLLRCRRMYSFDHLTILSSDALETSPQKYCTLHPNQKFRKGSTQYYHLGYTIYCYLSHPVLLSKLTGNSFDIRWNNGQLPRIVGNWLNLYWMFFALIN